MSLRIAVLGGTHLGTVVAACAAHLGHRLVLLDDGAPGPSSSAAASEPELVPMIDAARRDGRLTSSTEWPEALATSEILWVAEDVALDAQDRPDTAALLERVRRAIAAAPHGQLVLVSSQFPVGTIRSLEGWAADHGFGPRLVAVPENLRVGSAVESFLRPDRVVIGTRDGDEPPELVELFSFARHVEWMSVESAEMTKHALNAFLATSVALTNEIARLCEEVGAEAVEVERGLRSDPRIGPAAYVRAGEPYSGGTLARDVGVLSGLADAAGLPDGLPAAVARSNRAHADWPIARLVERFGGLQGLDVAVLGAGYKPGGGSERSWSVELCAELVRGGAAVRVHDPASAPTPAPLPDGTSRVDDRGLALVDADAVVIATPSAEFAGIHPAELARMRHAVVLDVPGVAAHLAGRAEVEYLAVGSARFARSRFGR